MEIEIWRLRYGDGDMEMERWGIEIWRWRVEIWRDEYGDRDMENGDMKMVIEI